MEDLTKDAIFNRPRPPQLERLEVAAWGGVVYAKMLRASDAKKITDLMKGAPEEDEAREVWSQAAWCAIGICDKDGNRLFDDDDVTRLLEEPIGVIQQCGLAVLRLNGYIDDGESEKNE